MVAVEVGSGILVLAIAAAVLSPYCAPPIHRSMQQTVGEIRAFMASIPGRRASANLHWQETKDAQRCLKIGGTLCTLGTLWLVWVAHGSSPLPDAPASLKLLFWGIGIGTSAAGYVAGSAVWLICAFVWEGFWGRSPSLPTGNPINRVGTAAPLGEGAFAEAGKIDAALAGRSSFIPPTFRD